MFEPIDYEKLNETDVREEIIAPFLRELGYRSGTPNDVIREQSLRYPRIYMGRKNASKDPLMRGKADYILDVQNTVRWVLEAKAPDVELSIDVLEQAWTYATHPEIRAVYFAICNGTHLHIFQSSLPPSAKAVLTVAYESFAADFGRIENLIGPEALLRDHPRINLDTGDPIGDGLRSVVRITNGLVQYHQCNLDLPIFKELQIGI